MPPHPIHGPTGPSRLYAPSPPSPFTPTILLLMCLFLPRLRLLLLTLCLCLLTLSEFDGREFVQHLLPREDRGEA